VSDVKPAKWEVVTIPSISPDHALAIRARGVDGYIEVKTRTNFTDLKADADTIAHMLNGDSFGLTREDVEAIENGMRAIESECFERGSGEDMRRARDGSLPEIAALRNLADRIEALLPPSDSTRAQDE
jgi:hypothetical protein